MNPYESILPGLAIVEYSLVNDLGAGLSTARIETYGAATGVVKELANSWGASLSGNYALEKNRLLATNITNAEALSAALADPNPATAFNPFGSGGTANNPATVRSLSGFQSESSDFRVQPQTWPRTARFSSSAQRGCTLPSAWTTAQNGWRPRPTRPSIGMLISDPG